MSVRTVVLMACFTALWIAGLVGQFYSAEAVMRYLALSMALVAVCVWRMEPRPVLRRIFRNARRPRE
jgi:hypothetical protein